MRSEGQQEVSHKRPRLLKKSLSDWSVVQNGPKHHRNRSERTTKWGSRPPNRGQTRTRKGFSTASVVFETLPAVLRNACACSHLYSAPLHVVVWLITTTSAESRFTI